MAINKKIILGFLIIAISLLSSITAFAVSSTYWSENPLRLYPGETKDFQFTLQNLAGTENITVKAALSKGSEIAEITDASDVYKVPAGEKTKVNLRATLDNAKIGDVYPLEITFTTVTESETGTFGLGSSIKQGFNIEIVEEPKTTDQLPQEKTQILTWIIIAAAIIILLIAIIIILKKRKK